MKFNRFFLMYCGLFHNAGQLRDWKAESASAILPLPGQYSLPSNHSAISCEDSHQTAYTGLLTEQQQHYIVLCSEIQGEKNYFSAFFALPCKRPTIEQTIKSLKQKPCFTDCEAASTFLPVYQNK